MWWSIKLDISCFRITVFHFLCRNRSFTRMKAVCVNTGVHNLLYRGVQRGDQQGWFSALTLLCLCISSWTSLQVTASPNVMSLRGITQKREASGEWGFCSCISLRLHPCSFQWGKPFPEAPTQASFSSSLIVQEWATGRMGKGQLVFSASVVGVGSTRKEEGGWWVTDQANMVTTGSVSPTLLVPLQGWAHLQVANILILFSGS